MKRLIDMFRALLISWETIVLIVSLIILFNWEKYYALIGKHVFVTEEHAKYLSLLPAGMLTYLHVEAKQLLRPEGTLRDKYMKWNGYNRVKDRIYLSYAISSFFAGLAIVFWLSSKLWSDRIMGFILITSIIENFIVLANVVVARISLQQLVNENYDL